MSALQYFLFLEIFLATVVVVLFIVIVGIFLFCTGSSIVYPSWEVAQWQGEHGLNVAGIIFTVHGINRILIAVIVVVVVVHWQLESCSGSVTCCGDVVKKFSSKTSS